MCSPSYASRAAPTTGRARDRHDYPRTRAPAGRDAGRLPGRPRPRARRGAQGPRPLRRRAHLSAHRAGGRHPDAARGPRRPGAAGGDLPRHRSGGGRVLRAHLGARADRGHHRGGRARDLPPRRARRRGPAGGRRRGGRGTRRAAGREAAPRGVLERAYDRGDQGRARARGDHGDRAAPPARPRVRAVAGAQPARDLDRRGAGLGALLRRLRGHPGARPGTRHGDHLLGVRAAEEHLGAGGLYLASALSAIVSVDAPTVALAHLGGGTTGWSAPAAAIGVVAITNTLVKFGIAIAYGAGSYRSRVATALGVMSVLGGLTGLAVLGRF